jgi:serine/threonine-protein kinase
MRAMAADSPATLASSVAVGEVLAGKYRVESIIGEGGMGLVVCAMHLQLEHRVAIKFLRSSVLGDDQVTARFSREAKAAAKIRSEYVARVLDVGVLENGAPYIVMEYLEGIDLRRTLRERGALGPEEAAGYVLQACEAIAEAHAVGIIHRDLKPANLFLARQSSGELKVKVLDFGISKDIGASAQGLTTSHTLMGTPYYMSPEQLTSPKEVDPRTDIWSLGIILFELLTGQPPYRGGNLPEVVAAVLRSEPPSHRLPEGTPESIRKVIDRCLLHSLSGRYQNVSELVADLAVVCPLQGQASSARISGALHLVAQGEAARRLREDAHAPAHEVEKAGLDSDRPTKNARLLSGETPNSWQVPSMVALMTAKVGKYRFAAIGAASALAGLLTLAGARVAYVHMAAPRDAVAPALPSQVMETVRPPEEAKVPPDAAPAVVSTAVPAVVPPIVPAASSGRHRPTAPPAPRVARAASVASAAKVSQASKVPPPVSAPVNALDIPIK